MFVKKASVSNHALLFSQCQHILVQNIQIPRETITEQPQGLTVWCDELDAEHIPQLPVLAKGLPT